MFPPLYDFLDHTLTSKFYERIAPYLPSLLWDKGIHRC